MILLLQEKNNLYPTNTSGEWCTASMYWYPRASVIIIILLQEKKKNNLYPYPPATHSSS